MKNNRGFTLIELLVVIAIIGILSSVVLASLGLARGKSKDVAIKSDLANMRGQAEIFYESPGNYGTASFTAGSCSALTADTIFGEDERVQTFLAHAGDISSGSGIAGTYCVSTSAAWAVSVPLFTDSALGWCVDNQGSSKQVTVALDYGFSGTACE